MVKITVVCREVGYPDILIYTVEVENSQDHDEVQTTIHEERNHDLEDDANDMEILFAFAGDIPTLADWRT